MYVLSIETAIIIMNSRALRERIFILLRVLRVSLLLKRRDGKQVCSTMFSLQGSRRRRGVPLWPRLVSSISFFQGGRVRLGSSNGIYIYIYTAGT